jgi:hypothetical protein
MVPAVAQALAALGQRDHATTDRDLVFVGEAGGYIDASAMRRRYVEAQKRAGLRPLRFHEYADVFVMPTLVRRSCSERRRALACRHNQSASRKARSASGGW